VTEGRVRAGIDIGSRAVKLVVMENGSVVRSLVEDTGSDPLAVCRRLLAGVTCDSITATGYGRHLFQERWPSAGVISEIKAVARGAVSLLPACRTVIDIGGQDSKAISLGPDGRVRKSVMNDRCAAGSGQFLEMMATALAYGRDEFVAAAARAGRAERLNSMCTVFAQSEVVSLIARGASREEIAFGVHQSIAGRTAALAGGLPLEETIVFTGGCARNPRLVALLGEALKRPVHVPPDPQTVAALGCALGGAPAPAG
jgi:predicted CoA-substrate-specific enzyme activase